MSTKQEENEPADVGILRFVLNGCLRDREFTITLKHGEVIICTETADGDPFKKTFRRGDNWYIMATMGVVEEFIGRPAHQRTRRSINESVWCDGWNGICTLKIFLVFLLNQIQFLFNQIQFLFTQIQFLCV
tara:strand:- start:31 stop:423 length:393 start_codon:yes stop_codon:yes gene_type:complete